VNIQINIEEDMLRLLLQYADSNDISAEDAIVQAVGRLRTGTPAAQRNRPADARIKDFVQQIMDRNLNAKDPTEKIAITQGHLKAKGGFGFNAVKRFFETHQEIVDEHHAEIGIDDPVNWNKTQAKAQNRSAQAAC
jgi:hypothetical protein